MYPTPTAHTGFQVTTPPVITAHIGYPATGLNRNTPTPIYTRRRPPFLTISFFYGPTLFRPKTFHRIHHRRPHRLETHRQQRDRNRPTTSRRIDPPGDRHPISKILQPNIHKI